MLVGFSGLGYLCWWFLGIIAIHTIHATKFNQQDRAISARMSFVPSI